MRCSTESCAIEEAHSAKLHASEIYIVRKGNLVKVCESPKVDPIKTCSFNECCALKVAT